MKNPCTHRLLVATITALIALPVSAAQTPESPAINPPASLEVPADPTATSTPTPESDAERTEMPQMGDQDPLTTTTESTLLALSPDQLTSMTVVDPLGNEVGKIKQVVRSRHNETIEAVISSGGLLGFGAKEIAVPIDTLELSDQQYLEIHASSEELKAREDYIPQAYVALEPTDKPIGEFEAVEPIPADPAMDASPPQRAWRPRVIQQPTSAAQLYQLPVW